MAKVNMVSDLLEKHTDAEIIEHLYRVLLGVSKNYKISLEKGDPSVLWANLSDIELSVGVLGSMAKKNAEKLAQAQN